jgi:hypothetical protein
MNRPLNPVLVLVLVALVGMWVAGAVLTSPGRDARPPEPTFTAFLGELEQGELRDVVLHTRDNSVRVTPGTVPATRSVIRPSMPASWSSGCAPPRSPST